MKQAGHSGGWIWPTRDDECWYTNPGKKLTMVRYGNYVVHHGNTMVYHNTTVVYHSTAKYTMVELIITMVKTGFTMVLPWVYHGSQSSTIVICEYHGIPWYTCELYHGSRYSPW